MGIPVARVGLALSYFVHPVTAKTTTTGEYMQTLKIIGFCVLAAVAYGVVHDQFTARVCVEYFSVFHPPIFGTESPTLLALGWGVVATWWMGAFLGVLLALSARVGSQRKIEANELVWPISKLLLTMGILAAAAGFVGYMLGSRTAIVPPPWVSAALPPTKHARFMADWWAHNTSYLSGFLGGIGLCVATIRKRLIRERDAIIVISNAVE